MPKFSALKLVDEAILPVVLVFAGKIVTAFIVCILFDIVWNFNLNQSSYNLYFLTFSNSTDLYLVNSFSDLAMILITSFGFVWVLFRHINFGEENLHPIKAAKLHKKRQEQLIVTSWETYHQAAVWLSLSWFGLLLVLNSTIAHTTSYLNLGVAVASVTTLTLILGKNQQSLSVKDIN